MNEYIIINKSTLQKMIDESSTSHLFRERVMLEKILSQSIPLIPILEQSYEAGKLDLELSNSFDDPKGRYFNSLKLDV